MKLIVGLGNPEIRYENTFHNLGFMGLDVCARILKVEFTKEKCRALIGETKINGEKIILAKPLTYMNLSGESVSMLASFFKIPLKDIIVIYDDFDIPIGTVRIRQSGSAGTHNGMKNIVKELGSTEFSRIRIGFKPLKELKIPLIDFVLSGISEDDKAIILPAIERAGTAASEFAKGENTDKIMQKYNG